MPRSTLTDITIRSAKIPQKGTATLWDEVQPKLGIRISAGGAKSFIILIGSGQRQSIGRYPDLSLKEARSIASKKFAEKALGRHVAPTIKFAEAFTQYGSTHCDIKNKPRTAAETKRLITKHFLPKFKTRSISEITTSDISKTIDKLLETPAEANHAFAAIRGMFAWAARRKYVENSPCAHLQMPSKSVARDRVLTDDELITIYLVAGKFGFPYGSIIQLLLLTGQRRGEIAALRREWIDEDKRTITLPATLTKNKRQHTFPYGKIAADVLNQLFAQSQYIFPAARDRSKSKPATIFAGWGKSKRTFDDALEKAGVKIAPWTLHDLRRTFATGLASFGTPIHVTEKVLNHISGTTGGLVAVYQRHAYEDEIREAVDAWEAHVARLLQSRHKSSLKLF